MPQRYKLILTVASIALTASLASSAAYFYFAAHALSDPDEPPSLLSPLANGKASPEMSTPEPSTTIPNSFHLLLLGLDRRSRNQTSYRTDAIMVVSILKEAKKVILTSIPRDLWLDGAKINAFFSQGGFKSIKEKVKTVTGIDVSHYVSVDFDAAVWAIDQLGGVETAIERSFTDYNYPADRPGAPHPPSFQAGLQTLTGEEALEYCRSRKGTAGEGSDFRRMHRQQNLLTSLPQAFEKSNLAKLGAEALYNLLTSHIETNLGVGETAALLSLLKNYRDYQIERIVLEPTNFLHHPPSANYGGAYVLRPKNDTFQPIHDFITSKIVAPPPPTCSSCGR